MKVLNLYITVASSELSFAESWNETAKNDTGKEVKPLMSTAENLNPNITNDTGETDTDEEKDNGQSWHEVLDPELQPEQPIPDNHESQEIYADHSRLAIEYLRVETKLYFAQDIRKQILQEMNPDERKQKEDLLQKLKEKEELLELYNNLKSSIQASNEEQTRSECTRQYQNDLVPDDSWVVISSSNQNS